MTIRARLRSLIEPTLLGPVYRNLRDEYAFRHARFVRNPHGFMFSGHQAMADGTFETAEIEEIKSLLSKAEVFIDVGANVGYFSCLAASMGKHVVAIEPLAANLRFLLGNICVNQWESRVEVFPLGVSDAFGVAKFYGSGTGASLQEGWAGATKHFCTTVALSSLDTLLARFKGRRMVIKVDVEGAEYAALKGGGEIMRSIPSPAWLIEITLSEHRGATTNSAYLSTFDLFFEGGYRCRPVGMTRYIGREEIKSYAAGGAKPDWAASGNFIFEHGAGVAPSLSTSA